MDAGTLFRCAWGGLTLSLLAAMGDVRAEAVAPKPQAVQTAKSTAKPASKATGKVASPRIAQRSAAPLQRPYDMHGIQRPVNARPVSMSMDDPQTEQIEPMPAPMESGDPMEFDSAPFAMESELGMGCGSEVCSMPCAMGPYLYAGFEASLVQPRFDNNVGLTVMESNGSTLDTFTDQEFNYDMEFAQRVYGGLQYDDGIGLRATYWQLDHDADLLTAQPPANGFGQVINPTFGSVDISSNVPTDVFTAASGMNAYTIDLDAVKETEFAMWRLGATCGVRYGSIDQTYVAELRDSGDDLRGRIQFNHRNEGVGPTIGMTSLAPLTNTLDLFGKARGSLLFGRSTSQLTAGEDLDLGSPLNTARNTARDDLLPIAEMQLGVKWSGGQRGPGGALVGYQPFATVAMEGQFWSGVGNAVSETGDLGFFGVTAGAGVLW